MSLYAIQAWWNAQSRWVKAACAAWVGLLLFFSVRVLINPVSKTVYPIYSASGAFWIDGIDLYAPDRPESAQGGYRYSPTFAILCIPFAVLPDGIGGVLWRLVCSAGLIGAIVWMARVATARPMASDPIAWLILLCLPLSIQSLSNGQANILIAATLVASIPAVMEKRWNLVAVLVGVAFACKVYPLALGLLLAVLYPRQLGWRVPLAVVATLLLPFALQRPDYVIEQYAEWFAVLRRDNRSAIVLDQAYRDLWLLIRLYGIPMTWPMYVGIQLASAAGVAFLCWLRQRAGWSQEQLLTSTLALAAAWMMLLGPTTESCSFILMAPSLSWSIVEVLRSGASKSRIGLLAACCACFIIAAGMAGVHRLINIHAFGAHSWACVFYFGFLLTERRVPAKMAAATAATEMERRLAA